MDLLYVGHMYMLVHVCGGARNMRSLFSPTLQTAHTPPHKHYMTTRWSDPQPPALGMLACVMDEIQPIHFSCCKEGIFQNSRLDFASG